MIDMIAFHVWGEKPVIHQVGCACFDSPLWQHSPSPPRSSSERLGHCSKTRRWRCSLWLKCPCRWLPQLRPLPLWCAVRTRSCSCHDRCAAEDFCPAHCPFSLVDPWHLFQNRARLSTSFINLLAVTMNFEESSALLDLDRTYNDLIVWLAWISLLNFTFAPRAIYFDFLRCVNLRQ